MQDSKNPSIKKGVMAKILLAEDDDAVRSFVARALRQRGHDVTAVADGLQAQAALDLARYDMLLSDIVMPGMDGIALAMHVERAKPQMPVLLMSGYSAERQRAYDQAEPMTEVLIKPFSLRQLVMAVEGTLSGIPKAAAG